MATCTGDQYVQNIERTECIGNSLVKINNNFKNLDVAVCETGNDIEGLMSLISSLSSNLSNIRTTYIPITGTQAGSVAGTGNLSTVTGLSYDSGYTTKSGSVTYTLSGLRGAGLNPSKISSLYIVADVRMYASSVDRKANLYVTYPSSGYKPLLQTIIDSGISDAVSALVATSVRTTCVVPINQNTNTVSLSVQTDYASHGERAYYQIIGATVF